LKLSKLKLFAFFGVLALLLWALYPRGMLLGYIYEGLADLSRSEAYYRDYLLQNPTDKRAVVRLVSVYDRLGEPNKANELLAHLYDHRPTDFEVASLWLDHLENVHDENALYDARLKVARNLMQSAHPPKQEVEDLLSSAFAQARWNHKVDDMEEILATLLIVARDKVPYREELKHLYFNVRKTDKLLAILKERLRAYPDDIDTTEELIVIDMTLGNLKEAQIYIDSALHQDPNSPVILQLQVELLGQQKQYAQQVLVAKNLLSLHVLSTEEEWGVTSSLAEALVSLGKFDEAMEYYQALLAQDRSNPNNWLNVMSVLDRQGKYRDLLALLKDYLQQFPEDSEQKKMLAETYLYKLKDLSVLPVYREYVESSHSLTFAMDVGNSLADAKLLPEAIDWITEMLSLFPRNQQMILSLAEWSAVLHRTADAQHWYVVLADLTPNDATLQLKIGSELFALADPKDAEVSLNRVVKMDANNADAWFWLSEIHAQNNMTLAKSEAQRVVTLLEGRNTLDEQHSWMLLHSRMRLRESPKVLLPDYAVAVAQYPHHADLLADEIDLMIESHHLSEARARISDYQRQFPKDARRVRLMQVRLAFVEKDWKAAIALLEPMANETPGDEHVANDQWGVKRDLGEAYYNDGQWWKALPLLEKVQAATGERYQVATTIFDLHKNYDTRVTPLFSYTRFGSEYFTFGGVQFKKYLTHNWELNSEVKEGYFASPSSNYSGYTETGSVTVASHHLRPWHVSLGVEGAGSSERTTASPTLTLEYRPEPDTFFQFLGTYRKLRQDLPQAVAFGNLMDIVQFQGQRVFFDRLVLSAKYWYERDYLPSGASAHGSNTEPSAQVIIFKKPYVTLGWQMDYIRLNSDGNFLNSVPLIPYMNAQYAVGAISGRPVPELLLEGSFYDGHDFDRGLSILGGDLWGVRGGFDWAATHWLDIFGSYEFGRQRLLDIPGYSSFVKFGLSGHW